MAAKITISIPNKLFERFQAEKHNFNVSRVCQEAIKVEVSYHERASHLICSDDLPKIVERLKAEKEKFSQHFISNGHRQGHEDAHGITYQELVAIVEEYLLCESRHLDTGLNVVMNVGTWTNWLGEKVTAIRDLENEMYRMGRSPVPFDVEPFLRGWCKGVVDFWYTIEDKVIKKVPDPTELPEATHRTIRGEKSNRKNKQRGSKATKDKPSNSDKPVDKSYEW